MIRGTRVTFGGRQEPRSRRFRIEGCGAPASSGGSFAVRARTTRPHQNLPRGRSKRRCSRNGEPGSRLPSGRMRSLARRRVVIGVRLRGCLPEPGGAAMSADIARRRRGQFAAGVAGESPRSRAPGCGRRGKTQISVAPNSVTFSTSVSLRPRSAMATRSQMGAIGSSGGAGSFSSRESLAPPASLLVITARQRSPGPRTASSISPVSRRSERRCRVLAGLSRAACLSSASRSAKSRALMSGSGWRAVSVGAG